MEIKGYKAFNKDITNRYGIAFEEGMSYYSSGKPKFGNTGNGFHFCENLEDTLRYFPAMDEEIRIAEVTGFGDIVTENDEYYGYYDMHASSNIRIDKILDRQEIIDIFLDDKVSDQRLLRFVSLFKLTEKEMEAFIDKRSSCGLLIPTLEYYQCGDKDAFSRYYDNNIYKGLKKTYPKLKVKLK